jgi:hypothetical protein
MSTGAIGRLYADRSSLQILWDACIKCETVPFPCECETIEYLNFVKASLHSWSIYCCGICMYIASLCFFKKRYIDLMPHLITTHTRHKCYIISMKLCLWNCALGVKMSLFWKADVADFVTVSMKLPLRLALSLGGLYQPSLETNRWTRSSFPNFGSLIITEY